MHPKRDEHACVSSLPLERAIAASSRNVEHSVDAARELFEGGR
jgi:hypothetical protein